MIKKDLESLCLNEGDCAALYDTLKATGDLEFETVDEFSAGLANAEVLQMLRNSAIMIDKMRELGYDL